LLIVDIVCLDHGHPPRLPASLFFGQAADVNPPPRNRCMGRWLGSKEPAAAQKPQRPPKDPVAIFHSLAAERICEDCREPIYGESRVWRTTTVCSHCHAGHLAAIPAAIRDYIATVYGRGCEFCGSKTGRFHLDHVNMFVKTAGVIQMMESGSDLETLTAEVAACQLLCVPCHEIVSAFEAAYGFTGKKAALNQMIRERGSADPEVCKKRAVWAGQYSEVMGQIYPLIRSVVSGRRREEGDKQIE